jgi:hypothetical protein
MKAVKFGSVSLWIDEFKGKTEKEIRESLSGALEADINKVIDFFVPKQAKPKPTKKAK